MTGVVLALLKFKPIYNEISLKWILFLYMF